MAEGHLWYLRKTFAWGLPELPTAGAQQTDLLQHVRRRDRAVRGDAALLRHDVQEALCSLVRAVHVGKPHRVVHISRTVQGNVSWSSFVSWYASIPLTKCPCDYTFTTNIKLYQTDKWASRVFQAEQWPCHISHFKDWTYQMFSDWSCQLFQTKDWSC